ncbi:MAG: polysaccharide deacetylase family protein [Solirubrobacterales bacterium]|nr:polysaccharide deacetylase family protein [Solirubrobacterales bacterium]
MYECEFHWPEGQHIAVVFNISWETWTQDLGTSRNNQRPGESVPPGAEYDRWMYPVYEHAYAETAGMQRLLDVWRRHEIQTSVYVSGLAVTLFPELARRVHDEGHEFVVQGWDHSFLWEQTVAEQTESIDKTTEALTNLIGQPPVGYSASGGSITPESFDIIAERGFTYACGFRNVDVPFIIKHHSGRDLVGMNSYAISDYDSYGMQDKTARDVLQMWRDSFDALYAEGQRGSPQMLAFGTHPFLAHGFRTRPLEETIEYVQAKDNVWITTRGEIAEYMLREYPDRQISDFFPEAVASDAYYGLSMGVGGEEARREALRHRRPAAPHELVDAVR